MKKVEETQFQTLSQEDSECKGLSQYDNGQDVLWGLSCSPSTIIPFQVCTVSSKLSTSFWKEKENSQIH